MLHKETPTFFDSTTLHGVREVYYAHKQHKWYWMVFWSLIVTTMVILIGTGCFEIIKGFINAPLVTIVTTEVVDQMLLPDVAICYMGGPNVTKMRQAGMSEGLISSVIGGPMTGQSSSIMPLDPVRKDRDKLRKELDDFLRQEGITLHDLRTRFAFTCNDLIAFCASGQGMFDCCEGSEVIAHRDYGSCFTVKGKVQIYPGTSAGLLVCGHLPSIQDVFHKYGYSRIHGFGMEFGSPYKEVNLASYSVPAGQAVKVALLPRLIKRHGNCIPPGGQTKTNCHFQCWNRAMFEHCRCNHIITNINSDLPICDLFTSFHKYTECMKKASLDSSTCYKECKLECLEWQYDPSISYGTINNTEMEESLTAHGIIEKGEGYIHLEMVYPALEYTKYEEKEAFTLTMAVSNVGGQAGLWLGCSVITLIHALVHVLKAVFKACMGGSNEKQQLDDKSTIAASSPMQIHQQQKPDNQFDGFKIRM